MQRTKKSERPTEPKENSALAPGNLANFERTLHAQTYTIPASHDKRLKPLFEMQCRLQTMDTYHKERNALVSRIHKEQEWPERKGLTSGQINDVIHDRFALFDE